MTCCRELYFGEVYKSRLPVNLIEMLAHAPCGDSERVTRHSYGRPRGTSDSDLGTCC